MRPFQLEGPAYVSFSSGRTSGLMLRRCLDEGLGPDVHVLFFNTGKEQEASLVFAHRCATEWGAPITWLERPPGGGFRVVSFETASRNGEPFDALAAERGFVPNIKAPYCSTELKGRVGKAYMESLGHDEWRTTIGLRYDEPGRVARASGRKVEGGWAEHPLFAARLTSADVEEFWASQPFDLELQPFEGNCDLCFKKGIHKIRRIMAADPARAEWWIEKERATGTLFRIDRPSYARLADRVRRQVVLPMLLDGEEDSLPCGCTE